MNIRIGLYHVMLLTAVHSSLRSLPQPPQLSRGTQAWLGVYYRHDLPRRFYLAADGQWRRGDFLAEPVLYFIRGGAGYDINSVLSAGGGYAHSWLYVPVNNGRSVKNEHRLFQQVQLMIRRRGITLLQRFRVEQRWLQDRKADERRPAWVYSTRYRLLVSAEIPLGASLPALALSNEHFLQSGHDIVYNIFDQNRFFIGLKKQVNNSLGFDLGYQLVYQQKANGYERQLNHCVRCFVYIRRQSPGDREIPE